MLEQKCLEPEASTTISQPSASPQRRGPESFFTTLSNRSLQHGLSQNLYPSISSLNCSVFHSRCDSLPPIVPDPVPLPSCPVSPPPQTLIFSITTPEILLRPSLFRIRPERKRPPRRSSCQRHPHSNCVAEDNQRKITQTTLLTKYLSQIAIGHNRVLSLCSLRKSTT